MKRFNRRSRRTIVNTTACSVLSLALLTSFTPHTVFPLTANDLGYDLAEDIAPVPTEPWLSADGAETPLTTRSPGRTTGSIVGVERAHIDGAATQGAASTGQEASLAFAPRMTSPAPTPANDRGAGDYAALPGNAADSWSASGSTGSFTWSYPFDMREASAGATPSLQLSYDSSRVDGLTSSTNNQASNIGDGWALAGAGEIRQKFSPCSEQNIEDSYDLCGHVGGQEFTINYGGKSGLLVKDGATGKYRLESDDNSRIEYLTAAGQNPSHDGGYWKVTDSSGTQYYFGRNKLPGWTASAAVTNSVETTPVGAASASQPCYKSIFKETLCDQASTWKLDHVVDVHGNTQAYYYDQEKNWYKTQTGSGVMREYVRASRLVRVDYGMRINEELSVAAPLQVNLSYANRCEGIDCAKGTDVPTKFGCTSTGTCANYNATFYSERRLSSVSTRTKQADGSYQTADTWLLGHSMPDPGDGTTPALWLGSVTHEGSNTQAGAVVKDPPTVFSGQTLQNRVWAVDGLAPLNRYRITGVKSTTGGVTSISYVAAECTPSNLPASPETNNKRCFPQWWQPTTPIMQTERMDYFHIYPVASATVSGGPGSNGSEDLLTRYEYVGSPAWKYPAPKYITKAGASQLTWSVAAGWKQIRTIIGPSTTPDQNSTALTTFLRGLDGTPSNSTGGVRTETITTATNDVVKDSRWYGGHVLETQEFLGEKGPRLEVTTTLPRESAVTATGSASLGSPTARYIGSGKTITTQTVASGTRSTTGIPTFDTLGRVTSVSSSGDSSINGDETCVRTTFADNAPLNLLDLAGTIATSSGICDAAGAATGPLMSVSETFYDGSPAAVGNPGYVPPTKGNATGTRIARTTSGGSVTAWQEGMKVDHDALGRTIRTSDQTTGALRSTSIAFTPQYGNPTSATTTNQKGWTTTQTFDPVRGSLLAATDENNNGMAYRYDASGRQTGEWDTVRPRTSNPNPTVGVTYFISQTQPSYVKTERINSSGAVRTSFEIFDGLGRLRQTQEMSPSGGSIVADKLYDVQGNLRMERHPYYLTGAPSGSLQIPTLAVPSSTEYKYDAAGRTTMTRGLSFDNTEQWSKTTVYSGVDTATTTGPGDAPARTIVSDIQNRLTKDITYRGPSPTGASDTSLTSYDAAGNRASLTDAAGNRWTWSYDAQQRLTSSVDPDIGTSAWTFDDAGRKQTFTDNSGTTTRFVYDVHDRLIESRITPKGGAEKTLEAYTYDIAKKGKVDTKTRFNGPNLDQPVTTTFSNYNANYQAGSVKLTLPNSVEGFAGTYETKITYGQVGLPSIDTEPAIAGLPVEGVRNVYDALDNASATLGQFGDTYAGNSQYDNLSRLTTYSQFDSKLFTSGADTTGATRVTFNWDPTTGRLVESSALNEARGTVTDLGSTKYSYDALDRITSRDLSYKSRASGAGGSDYQCYRYSHAGQLALVWTPASKECTSGFTPGSTQLGGAAPYAQQYTYNSIGDRQQVKRFNTGGSLHVTEDYTYPAAGARGAHQASSVTRTTANGTSTTELLKWNEAGRLFGRGDQTISYTLDGRIEQTQGSQSSRNPNATTFDGTPPTAAERNATSGRFYDTEGSLVAIVDGTGTTAMVGSNTGFKPKTGAVSGVRTYSFSGKAVAQRVAREGSPALVSHLVGDTLNTTQTIVNPTSGGGTVGVRTVKRHLDPFGLTRGFNQTGTANAALVAAPASTITGSSNAPATNGFSAVHGYLSGLVDAVSNLSHLGARDLDRALGMFTAPDPIIDFGTKLGYSPYAYSKGDPVNSSDPSGLLPRVMVADGASNFGGPRAKVHKPAPQATHLPYLPGHRWPAAQLIRPVAPAPVQAPVSTKRQVLGWVMVGGAALAVGAFCVGTAGAGCLVFGVAANVTAGVGQYLVTTPSATVKGAVTTGILSGIPIPGGAVAGAGARAGVNSTIRHEVAQAGASSAAKTALVQLPKQLIDKNPVKTKVYLAGSTSQSGMVVYAGISKQFDLRVAQHARDNRNFMPPYAIGELSSRGEAKAVEQALIVRFGGARGRNGDKGTGQLQNIDNSISPSHPYYQQAVDWGEQWLKKCYDQKC